MIDLLETRVVFDLSPNFFFLLILATFPILLD